MENIEVLTDEKFKKIYTDKKFRNSVAYAHVCCNSRGVEEYKKALSYPVSYKVTPEQIKQAETLLKKQQKETAQKHKNNLLFVGMGMTYKTKKQIGNHRIRTEFLNADGRKFFVEFSRDCNGFGFHCCHSIDRTKEELLKNDHRKQSEYYNYKGLEKSYQQTKNLEYTPKNILNLVNKTFDCNFKKIFIDNYDLSPDGVLCKSPKKEHVLNYKI